MNLDFHDDCWSHNDDDWRRSLTEMLVMVKLHEQHAVLAAPTAMLQWCDQHLRLFSDYFRTRLAAAQPRAKGLNIRISPNGANSVTGPPPWDLNAEAARDIVGRPLRLFLENDESDLRFVASTVPSFSMWRDRGWVEPVMGGGSPMKAKIEAASADSLERWRTFFMFDSDRLHPDELVPGWTPPGGDGCQGHQFESACAAMPRERWHRLERRSIENYLPPVLLQTVKPATTASLTSTAVGGMARHYNMKRGLAGDGVSPANPAKIVRAARNKGFWLSLPPSDVAALETGFGDGIANEFSSIPPHHPWPADVIAEMTALADALQDAM